MKEKTDSVCKKFDDFFKIRSNGIIRESKVQQTKWNYILWRETATGEFTSEMIRDHLVIGIRDKTLSEKLQLDPGLKLEQAKKRTSKETSPSERMPEPRPIT